MEIDVATQKLDLIAKRVGEVDFLVEVNSRVLPVEVKSGGNFRSHKALDNLMNISNYALDEVYIFAPSNVVRDDISTYFPIYFLVKRGRYSFVVS